MAIYTVTHEYCSLRNCEIWVARKNGEWFGKIEPLTEKAAWALVEEDKFYSKVS